MNYIAIIHYSVIFEVAKGQNMYHVIKSLHTTHFYLGWCETEFEASYFQHPGKLEVLSEIIPHAGGTFMWLGGTLKKSSNTLIKIEKKHTKKIF